MLRMAMMAGLLAGLVPAAASGCARPDSAGSLRLAGPTELGRGTTAVPIRIDRERLAAAGGRARLVIAGLAFDSPPRVMLALHLEGRGGRRSRIGLINFYNQSAPDYGGARGRAGRWAFDVTRALDALGGEAHALVFEPTTGVKGGRKAAVDPAVRLRFASVSLEPL